MCESEREKERERERERISITVREALYYLSSVYVYTRYTIWKLPSPPSVSDYK